MLARRFAFFSLTLVLLTVAPAALLAAEAAEEHAGPDVPGLVPPVDLTIWSLVTFGIFVALLTKFAWGPLRAALDERETKIKQNIADAQAQHTKAAALLKEYEVKLAKAQEEVKEVLAEARRDAQHTKDDIVAAARKEADATRERAVAEIERARNVAMAELFDFVSNNVVQATERVLQRSMTGDDQQRLVHEALAELNVRRN